MSCNFVRIRSNEIIATSNPPSLDRRRTSSKIFENHPDQFRKNCKLFRMSKIESRNLLNCKLFWPSSDEFQIRPRSSGPRKVRKNCDFVRTIAMQKCKLQPTRRRSTNEFGQVENSCGRVRRLFGRGRVIKRVLNKKKVKLVRSDCKFAIASGRVRTSCNFHTVRRPSLRTSSDELQSRPDSFGLTAKSSGRVRTSLKLFKNTSEDSGL